MPARSWLPDHATLGEVARALPAEMVLACSDPDLRDDLAAMCSQAAGLLSGVTMAVDSRSQRSNTQSHVPGQAYMERHDRARRHCQSGVVQSADRE